MCREYAWDKPIQKKGVGRVIEGDLIEPVDLDVLKIYPWILLFCFISQGVTFSPEVSLSFCHLNLK